MLFHETPTTGPCADRAAAMQALVPVIETERLVLRAPVIEDFQVFARIVLGPQGRYFGHPKTREDAWGEFMQIAGTWYLRGHGAWMITLRATGALIGVVLLGAEPGDTETELGYLLDAEHQGKGFATEAAAAARDHAIGPMALPSLMSFVYAPNTRSIAVADRLGAYQDPPHDWPHPDTLVFRHHPKAAHD